MLISDCYLNISLAQSVPLGVRLRLCRLMNFFFREAEPQDAHSQPETGNDKFFVTN